MSTEHTPTPWAATTRQGSWDWVVYQVSNPNIEICQPFHDGTEDNPTGEANAQLIVEAVNNYDRLVAETSALRKALEEMTRMIASARYDEPACGSAESAWNAALDHIEEGIAAFTPASIAEKDNPAG